MLNVVHKVKDGKLTLTIDVSKATLDDAGKLRKIATTGGWVQLGPVCVSLNVVVK